MVLWPPPHKLGDSVFRTLGYSLKFSYPLTAREIWFWQVGTNYSLSQVTAYLRLLKSRKLLIYSQGFYSLPDSPDNSPLRLTRRKNSLPKMKKALATSLLLRKFPTIQAVFLTGTLAMLNCQKDDDIDIFIVTLPHTLWITRFFTVLYLKKLGLRRPPHILEHSSARVSDTICDNLWLDSHRLKVDEQSLYIAHEILQAKVLWDRGGSLHRLLTSNSWVGEYLPVAYVSAISSASHRSSLSVPELLLCLFLAPFNVIFFILQMWYMFPRKTREKVGLGFAFFHPSPQA